VPTAESSVCERLGITMVWGVGGEAVAVSSSRINEALADLQTRRSNRV
jgi:hypothetical protein